MIVLIGHPGNLHPMAHLLANLAALSLLAERAGRVAAAIAIAIAAAAIPC